MLALAYLSFLLNIMNIIKRPGLVNHKLVLSLNPKPHRSNSSLGPPCALCNAAQNFVTKTVWSSCLLPPFEGSPKLCTAIG